MKLIIIIPAYNEEKTIGSVIRGIPENIFGISEKEIIVIDDGSTDNTAKLSQEAGARVVSHPENKGLGAAFSTGIKEALSKKADLMVNIDADGQFDARDIPRLIQPILNEEADLAIGSRFMKGSSVIKIPKIKLLGNKIMAIFISRICGKRLYDVSCGFRAYSKEALLHLNLFGGFTYTQEAILNLSFKNLKITEIPIGVRYFSEKKSFISGNLLNYILKTMKIIFRTILDYRPLRFLGGFGIFLFSLGLVLDILMLCIFLQIGQFTPYKFIGISGLSFNLLGLVFFTIGLMADILNRIRQTQERTLYYQKKKFYYGG